MRVHQCINTEVFHLFSRPHRSFRARSHAGIPFLCDVARGRRGARVEGSFLLILTRISVDSPSGLDDYVAMNTTHMLAVSILVTASTLTAFAADSGEKDLRVFYRQNCVGCHGPDGAALTPEGKRLKGEDFTSKDFQTTKDDGAMADVILKGKFFGLAMPAFKKLLTREEAVRMVSEILRKAEKGRTI